MNSGCKIRLNRLFNNKGKMFLLPMDHRLTQGVNANFDIERIINLANSYINAIMVRPSQISKLADFNLGNIQIVCALTGKLDRGIDHEIINSAEYALSVGADALNIEIKYGSEFDLKSINKFYSIIENAHKYGFPILITIYAQNNIILRDGDKAYANACIIAEEIGADIIKTNFPKNENVLEMINTNINTPIIVAGGSVVDDIQLLTDTEFYIKNGIKGVAYGRNIWCKKNPQKLIKDISRILMYE
jgi:fructose-bisphosphate aldolase/2-amino-3,7-dideoxy-D-threo-hept-6-ulosonate synthase